MIYSSKDKYLGDIVKKVNNLAYIKAIKDAKDLYIYGLSEQRGFNYAIPEQFINSRRFVEYIQTIGVDVKIASFWGDASTYNYNCLGIGFNLRKKSHENCIRIISCVYLWLNEKIDHGTKKKARRMNDIENLMRELRGRRQDGEVGENDFGWAPEQEQEEEMAGQRTFRINNDFVVTGLGQDRPRPIRVQ